MTRPAVAGAIFVLVETCYWATMMCILNCSDPIAGMVQTQCVGLGSCRILSGSCVFQKKPATEWPLSRLPVFQYILLNERGAQNSESFADFCFEE